MNFWIDKTKNESETTFFMFGVRVEYEWLDNFETFLEILVHDCGCTLISDEFVVYIRKAELEKNGSTFSFYHDSLDGAYVCSKDDETVKMLEALTNDVLVELEKRAADFLSMEDNN